MKTAHFYNKYGADILRLWVSSVDWQNEVPFGEDLFKQTTEPYRRFRNIFKILLGNLNDFDAEKDGVDSSELTTIDRWILERLHRVIAECRGAYEAFEFRKVFNTLNQFCANDLSALYVDITKDRMYCDAPDSSRRRATQTVMNTVCDAMIRLLAPILAFTADEAWEFAGHKTSVHIELFPEPDPEFAGDEATRKVELLSQLRDLAQVQVDAAIKENQFKKRERSSVAFTFPKDHPARELIKNELDDVLEFLMVSSISVEEDSAPEIVTSVAETDLPECPRCRRSIAVSSNHEECCERCAEVIQ